MINSSRKIALVCFSRSLGGLELSTLRLAKAMNSRGAHAMVIVPPSSPLQSRAVDLGISLAAIAPRWKYGDFSAARRLARILRENKIEIVVLMQSHDIHLASLALYFSPGIKLVFYQQMDSRHNKRDLFHSWVFSKLSLWITLTHAMKDNALFATRMPEAKVKVVPLGTDLHRFDPKGFTKLESRSYFGLPQDKKIIGVLGRLDPGKGQEILIRAVSEIVRRYSNIFLVVAGDETAGEPGYKSYLEKLCRTIAVEQYVKFFPFTDDVPRLMSALDIFVLPSFAETFGLVVIEAMAMEKPIVATKGGGLPEIISDGKTGLLVQPRSVEDIVCAVEKILADEALSKSLGHSAREDALRRFSMESCVDALFALFAVI
jgi:D-inositol-3-phosphate glycosyltransferase